MTTINNKLGTPVPEFKYILLQCKDKIASITLNRPKVLNALNHDLISELSLALDYLKDDTEICVLIISGGEKVFAAGADIENMVDITPEQARTFSFNDIFLKIEKLNFPVIAAIAGYALGAGFELALACDIRICSKDAQFGLPEIKLGIFPGGGGTQRLPRLIGQARAKEMIFFGNIIDADAAFHYGLCNKICKKNLMDEATSIAGKIASGPKVAMGLAKQVIDKGFNMDIGTGTSFETIAWAELFSTDDQKEGMKAFLAKRKPKFIGK
ncbi:MAG: enoyl-CoA hydratase/isomerase family protein [Desulfobacteraceae bacterium]|nr:enoyl-CoA hydratase/isomerase family protein [Desulfobacteraceae bacterium]